MKNKIQKLKKYITEISKNESFLHHDWFVQYHLEIVEKISLELCEIYKDANKDIVLTLLWIHDYGKILNMDKEHELNHESKKLLIDLGFPKSFTDKIFKYLEIFENKMIINLTKTPIEVQIVSSADGASHMIGPFFPIYWKEHSTKSITELMEQNRIKLIKDWERKIVLPEVKKAFKQRHKLLLEEHVGNFPENYITH